MVPQSLFLIAAFLENFSHQVALERQRIPELLTR
jgi:hypothetical protein